MAHDIIGSGPIAILLPALSSIATRDEMRPLAERLHHHFTCVLADWPGFGFAPPDDRLLSPGLLSGFLDRDLSHLLHEPVLGVAAGHGATYLVQDAKRHPGRYAGLVLVAPTWRGPLPTMTRGRRPRLCQAIRRALESNVLGPALYRLNLSQAVVAWMMREHVYADPQRVTPALVRTKQAVAHRTGGRLATAAFVSGGLDPVGSRAAFLALLAEDMPPTLLLRPRGAPRGSAEEMDALAATGRVTVAEVDGALAPHEEWPDAVAAAILSFRSSRTEADADADDAPRPT